MKQWNPPKPRTIVGPDGQKQVISMQLILLELVLSRPSMRSNSDRRKRTLALVGIVEDKADGPWRVTEEQHDQVLKEMQSPEMGVPPKINRAFLESMAAVEDASDVPELSVVTADAEHEKKNGAAATAPVASA